MSIIASTVAAALVLAQYGYGAPPPPPPSSYGPSTSTSAGDSLDTAPFVNLQRKCLDEAVAETAGSALDAKQKRFDTCLALHVAMVKHASAKLAAKDAEGVKRQLDRALAGIEKSYAQKLGVSLPTPSE